MELLLLLIFSAIFSILFNWASPKVMAYPRFARLQTSYPGRTALTTAVVFGFLVLISLAMSQVGEKPKLPS